MFATILVVRNLVFWWLADPNPSPCYKVGYKFETPPVELPTLKRPYPQEVQADQTLPLAGI